MPRIERDGATLAYEVAGQGPVILLGHSLLCDGRMWAEVVPELARGYRVINAVFRGHAPSRTPGPFTLDDLVGDQLAILDAEGVDRALVCGLSTGGMVGMRLAARAPGRVAGLALLDTSAGGEVWHKRLRYGLLATIYRRTGFTPFLLRRVAPLMFGPETLRRRPELVASLAEQMRAHERQQLVWAVQAVVRRTPFGGLDALRLPALVLVGEDDRATPANLSRAMAARLPDAELVSLPGAGHLSAMERPREVAAAILRLAGRAFSGSGEPARRDVTGHL